MIFCIHRYYTHSHNYRSYQLYKIIEMKHYIIYIFISIVFITKGLKIINNTFNFKAIILSCNKLIIYSRLNF